MVARRRKGREGRVGAEPRLICRLISALFRLGLATPSTSLSRKSDRARRRRRMTTGSPFGRRTRTNHEDRLFHLQLKKLSTRRAVIDLKFFHSILYRYSKINLSGVSFKESRTRGPKIKLSFKRAKTSVRQNAFLHRSKKQFGSLPIRIQSLEKQQDFLIAVDNFLP
uniref:Uncharacterized protein n=1 Tax=Panagrellus redivivus TaxID=6233 RepID=A0A7E4UNB5_PANRE